MFNEEATLEAERTRVREEAGPRGPFLFPHDAVDGGERHSRVEAWLHSITVDTASNLVPQLVSGDVRGLVNVASIEAVQAKASVML